MKHTAGVLGLFLTAVWFRWPAMSWMHVDERAFIVHPLGFFSGDLNPHFFHYPTFPFYMAWVLYAVYSFWLGLDWWDFLMSGSMEARRWMRCRAWGGTIFLRRDMGLPT